MLWCLLLGMAAADPLEAALAPYHLQPAPLPTDLMRAGGIYRRQDGSLFMDNCFTEPATVGAVALAKVEEDGAVDTAQRGRWLRERAQTVLHLDGTRLESIGLSAQPTEACLAHLSAYREALQPLSDLVAVVEVLRVDHLRLEVHGQTDSRTVLGSWLWSGGRVQRVSRREWSLASDVPLTVGYRCAELIGFTEEGPEDVPAGACRGFGQPAPPRAAPAEAGAR